MLSLSLSKIKLWVMGGLAALATLFYGLWQHTKSARAKDALNAEREARRVQTLGYEAADIGRVREREIREEDIDVKKRDHFE